jgi:hypothetical protein
MQVVGLLGGDQGGRGALPVQDDIARISAQALDAAQTGLEKAIDDLGLRYTFYLLTQLVLAARSDDWQRELAPFNIRLPADASIFDLTIELQGSIDDHLFRWGNSTDVSEMAQQAASEAITLLVGPHAMTLFGSTRDDLQFAVRKFSTKKGFSELGQLFFGRFMSRYLNFYLSRATADLLGRSRIRQVGDISAFNAALQSHCLQSALILRDFCGEWYSKTEFQKGIDLENTSGFLAHTLHKLRDELKRQGAAG